jgi:hypothetical protein
MTGPAPAVPPPADDLTARVFRALYAEFDLHTVGGTHIAVPKGAPCFAGRSLGEVARQISACEHQDPPAPAAVPSGLRRRRPAPITPADPK